MSHNRTILGLSVGSGFEGVDVAVVRMHGIGLNLKGKVERAARVPFPAAARDLLRPPPGTPSNVKTANSELTRRIAETATQAARTALAQPDRLRRELFAIGMLEPARVSSLVPDWQEIADHVADRMGFTVAHGFRGRDRAGGGTGHPIAAAADFLLYRDPAEERLLVHLGAVASIVHLPAKSERISDVQGFDAGPCNQLLDLLMAQGTRGREISDAGGKRAVQGCCVDSLLARWLEHPFFARKPPRALGPELFGHSFANASFDCARGLEASLPDLLCTASHLVARCVGEAVRRWLPPANGPRRIVLSGGGVRNGFLWQLLGQQFPEQPLARLDEVGAPTLGRNAVGAAVLAALLHDGVPGNLPLLTGAAAARLCGHLSPGEMRNWAKCTTWIAEQSGEMPRFNRAA